MAPSKTTNQINHDESKEKQTLLFMAGNPPKRFKPDAISRELRELLESSGSSKKFSYGTAGFRDDADLLVGVMTRVGMIAALRSIGLRNSNIGVMITASHNAEKDNGAKIVDDDGGMLAVNWEPLAEDLVNAPTADEAIATIERIQQSFSTDGNLLSTVLIARDTRPHSAKLAECVRRGAEAMGAKTFDLGEMTTPQLHFIVMYLNEAETYSNEANFDPYSVLSIYNQTLAGGYISLLATAAGDNRHTVIVDGSNGIGATQLPPLDAEIDRLHPGILTVDLRNRAGDGPVNEGCGAELVQKSQIPPASVSAAQDEGIPIASLDGDADRIVFHTFRTDGNWSLVDGDKIAALISTFILQEFTACDWIDKWKVGIVQTAYANGASTEFLARQGMEVVFAKTGVKYLHAKAHEFDCGVYFEANGHGTVLFSGALRTAIDVAFASLGTADDRHALAIRRIHACTRIINHAVGDAMSGLLLALGILKVLGMTFEDWCDTYTDLPSKQIKIPVSDKNLIRCSDNEMRVEEPVDLQVALESAMKKVPQGRCFVRPSGTEDCVRIYAEASTQEHANRLAEEAILAIRFFVR